MKHHPFFYEIDLGICSFVGWTGLVLTYLTNFGQSYD